MQIIDITNKEQLNNFVGLQKHSQFLQSWQWGEFHKIVSSDVFRVGVEKDNKIIAAATIIKKTLPMGKFYFYCPRGPILDKSQISNSKQILDTLFDEIKRLSQEQGVMFLRFDPISNIQYPISNIQQTLDIQPSKTLILSLVKSEAELLKNMHQKTRYNIRLAEKKGVKIIEAGLDKFDDFWKLMCETGNRDSFRTHGIDYYKEMTKLDQDFVKLFLAEYKGKVISAIVVSFFGDTATYMHGASSSENRNVMAPYLLQWHCIKSAKELGCKYYDFYGINEKKWPGVTKFKMGFCDKTVKYPGTFDLIFDSGWYNVYKMFRKVRRTF